MMSKYQHYKELKVELNKNILTVTMNRPDKANAINLALHTELSTIFNDAGSDDDVDVVILTGEGKAFSAGGDLPWLQNMIDDQSLWRRTVIEAKRIVFGIIDCEKPIIAKLNGATAGLGATIALYCDIIFASDRAKIGDPHVCVGFVAGDGGSAIWPQLIGYPRAKEYLMTGDLIPAAEAATMGLINHCVPHDELDERVAAFADRLANGPIRAIQGTKVAVNTTLRQLVSANIDASISLEGLSNQSDEHREGVAAFNEGRKPVFKK
ncbi:enoyl-CoA hydratase-related protein [Cycloclasticus sp.]|uniref:enoyl-CoA hydratase/isomerase family protein n=1 Tax=Cycloclasticus sp. TaxID=2024830 RepID=UPI00257BAAAD|nr:enoyl-CoA hydratase-related protein [Cycloclasticus sp.]